MEKDQSFFCKMVSAALETTPCLSTPAETAWLAGVNFKFLKNFEGET